MSSRPQPSNRQPMTGHGKQKPGAGPVMLLVLGGLVVFVGLSLISSDRSTALIVIGSGVVSLLISLPLVIYPGLNPLQWHAVASLANVAATDRAGCLLAAFEDSLIELRARFPEAEGYKYRVKEGANQGEAFRRDIVIRCGLNWGLNVHIMSTNQDTGSVALAVLKDAPLLTILGILAFVVGELLICIPAEPFFFTNPHSGTPRPDVIGTASLIGVCVGVYLAKLVDCLWSSLGPPKAAAANESAEIVAACVNKRAMAASTTAV